MLQVKHLWTLLFFEALEMLDRMTKKSIAWHTMDSDIASSIMCSV